MEEKKRTQLALGTAILTAASVFISKAVAAAKRILQGEENE
jgi:hypothetical protein